jgi:hypothetical protein
VQHLSHAIDIPMSPTLTRADCDDLVLAIRKVLRRRTSSLVTSQARPEPESTTTSAFSGAGAGAAAVAGASRRRE